MTNATKDTCPTQMWCDTHGSSTKGEVVRVEKPILCDDGITRMLVDMVCSKCLKSALKDGYAIA